jgi:Domain of unknown function (DUF222)
MCEVTRQAAAAHHYLVVFDNHTEQPLYLGRAKRLASTAQRIVLYARDPAARSPAAPPRPTTAKYTTAAPTGPTADSPTSTTKPWPAARQPPRQTRRPDHPQTQRRPYRMDPTTQPRYRPSPRQQLPPPPALPHPRRTQRDRRRRRRRSGRYLGLEELQQVGVDDVGMSGRHAVRKVLVGLQNSVGQKLG